MVVYVQSKVLFWGRSICRQYKVSATVDEVLEVLLVDEVLDVDNEVLLVLLVEEVL